MRHEFEVEADSREEAEETAKHFVQQLPFCSEWGDVRDELEITRTIERLPVGR
jgi:hypothetical protein